METPTLTPEQQAFAEHLASLVTAEARQDPQPSPEPEAQAAVREVERMIRESEPGTILRRTDRDVEVVAAEQILQEVESAQMRQGILAPVVSGLNSAIPDVQLGNAVFGGVTGLVLGEVVDGFVPPRTDGGNVSWTNILVKGGVAWATAAYGDVVLTRQGAIFASGVMALQIAQDLLPIESWVSQLVGMFQRGPASSAQEHARQYQEATSRQGMPVTQPGNDQLRGVV